MPSKRHGRLWISHTCESLPLACHNVVLRLLQEMAGIQSIEHFNQHLLSMPVAYILILCWLRAY